MDAIDYNILQSEKITLLELKNSNKIDIKRHKFRIIFDSKPEDVLKYGPNSLHFFEHIYYGIVSKEMKVKDGNASTFGTGAMDYYFIGESADIDKNIDGFFRGLNRGIDFETYKNIKEEMRIEQKRVMSEIKHYYNKELSNSISMFKINPDIYKGEFDYKCLWNILVGYCKIQKICLISHHELSQAQKTLFMNSAEKFLNKWNDMTKYADSPAIPSDPKYQILKEVEIQQYNIFPISEFNQYELHIPKGENLKVFDVSPIISINLNDIPSGIIRYILSSESGDVLFGKVEYPYEYLFDIIKSTLKIDIDITNDQFRYADILVASTNITQSDIVDITTKTRYELFKAHKEEILGILHKYVDDNFCSRIDKFIDNSEKNIKFGRKKTRFFSKHDAAKDHIKRNDVAKPEDKDETSLAEIEQLTSPASSITTPETIISEIKTEESKETKIEEINEVYLNF